MSKIPDNFIVHVRQELACHARPTSSRVAVIWPNENSPSCKAGLSVRSNPSCCYEKWNPRSSGSKSLVSRLLHHWPVINHEPLYGEDRAWADSTTGSRPTAATQIPVPDCGWEIWRICAYPERITSAYLRAALTVHVTAERIFSDLWICRQTGWIIKPFSWISQ